MQQCLNQFSNHFRNPMENQLKQLCLCIQQIAAIQETISSNRLSFSQAAAVMEMVDLKRRGFLDLNDIYELVGKVTENELFAIFKHLDRSRSGEIRVADLQAALGNSQLTSNNTQKEYVFPRLYKIVDTVKDRPKLIHEALKQYNFTTNSLKGVYQYLCELVQSKYLSQAQITTVFKTQFIKNALKWSQSCQGVVQQLLPGQNVSEVKLVQAFSTKNNLVESEEECLLNGISDKTGMTTSDKNQSIYTRLKSVDYSPKNAEKVTSYSRKVNNFLDTTEIRSPKFDQEVKTPTYLQRKTPVFNESGGRTFANSENVECKRQYKPQYKTNFDQIQNNISSVLDNIQQRRDKLRQDSIQRKKLIQDVMNRKKQLIGSNQWSSEGFTREFGQRQQPKTSNVKKVPKSYLNHNPTFYQTQQLSRHNEESNQPIRKPQVFLNNQGSNLPFERSVGHIKTASPPTFSPYEHKRSNDSAENSQIAQILKKYTPKTPENKFQETSFKTLSNSKSGFIYDVPSYYRENSGWKRQDNYQSYNGCRASSKTRDSYKENVMKRAEQEAAKKIEQIERKARMKVLEKKGRREDLEWTRLMRHNVNF